MARLRQLRGLGLGYLTLDRQSRTLSGGEVQRINLTTALGTSLVNTLFVLDEPSIGMHPSNFDGLVELIGDLLADGNSVLVVDHDVQLLREADGSAVVITVPLLYPLVVGYGFDPVWFGVLLVVLMGAYTGAGAVLRRDVPPHHGG